MPSALDTLIAALEEAYDRRSWHGTNLAGSLRGLTPKVALWRPAPARHNIWEVALHAAYWKYAVTRRLTGARRGSFALTGSNWFARDRGTLADLRADLRLLRTSHLALLETARAVAPGRLDSRLGHGKYTVAETLRGIAAHDLYHAGQIQLLKRLQAGR
jgi:uncharacterized damage-inducible protein DinB